MYVTWSNKKASLLVFILAQTKAVREKNSFKLHGRYVTSMSIILAVTIFSEKMEFENTLVFGGELWLH